MEAIGNLWMVSADFCDMWNNLQRSFQLVDKWSPFIGDHTRPDADMIPVVLLSVDGRPHGPERMSLFTVEEHYNLMTLISIAISVAYSYSLAVSLGLDGKPMIIRSRRGELKTQARVTEKVPGVSG